MMKRVLHQTGLTLVCVASLFLSGCAALLNNTASSNSADPISVDAQCTQREEDGYADQLRLLVRDNVVTEMQWTANPRQGKCEFNLADFKQKQVSPQIELQSKKSAQCRIYIWQNGQYISVSTLNCQAVCAHNERLLPVLLQPKSGACYGTRTVQ